MNKQKAHPIVRVSTVVVLVFSLFGILAFLLLPHPTAIAANEPVAVWLTLEDESKKLSQEPNLSFQAGSGSAAYEIQVNQERVYQQFEGAGAAMTDSSAWLIMNAISQTERNALMANLFTGAGDGINLSYVRVPMGASDFALSSYTYNDMPSGQTDPTLANFSIAHDEAYIIPALQQARSLNPQLRLMGSPWSAPAWMKENKSLNGGSLSPQFFDAFATYHVKFAEAYGAHGLPIDSLTPQNEPQHTTGSYPTMLMSADDQKTFVRDHLGPAIATAGLQTRLLVLDHNWNLINYPLAILADPAAKSYVAGTGFHCYGGDVTNQSSVYNAHPDKGIWFTECSGGGWSTDFGDNMTWNMKNLVVGNFRNWGKSLLLWNLALDENDGPQNGGCNNCRGVVTINQATQAIDYNVEYYVLGHVTKFVDPGAYRIDSTPFVDGQPENVAFQNPDGSIVLIVHATQAATFDVAWQGQHFTYSLPAQGTVTFKWNGNGVPAVGGVLQEFEAEGTYYEVWNATATLSNTARFGTYSLAMTGSGDWHTVGAYLNNHPVDARSFGDLCFWVYDTTGSNTVALKLVDSNGANQEIWSDTFPTPGTTTLNDWVQLCADVSAFTNVDLSALDSVQFTAFPGGTFLFDQITATMPGVNIRKSVALTQDPVQPGDVITYTIVVENGGTATAHDVRITDTLPAYVNGPQVDVTETISAQQAVTITWPVTVALNAPLGDTITNTAHFSHSTATGSDAVAFKMAPRPLGLLQAFEQEGTYYEVWNATLSLGNVAYAGLHALRMEGSGEWHTAGAYLYDRPIDATIYDKLCFQVYDTGGSGNTIAFKLVDGSGTSQEIWSDAFGNPTTAQNEWVEMCFDVSAYDQVDLTNLDSVQFTTYWGNPYYFDNVRGTLSLLSISKQVTLTHPIMPGDPLTYTISVANLGTAPAENVRVTDTLPAGLIGANLDETYTIAPNDSVVITIPARIQDDAWGMTITNTAFYSHTSSVGSAQAALTTAFAAADVFQDFEYPGSTYEAFNATVGITTTVTHSGEQAMFMVGSGEWHTGGAYAYNRPRDISSYKYLCFWIYDGYADKNTTALKLVDQNGASQETWSDWDAHSDNPNTHTSLNAWVKMCFNLSAYDLVDQTKIDSVQFTTYWGGPYYFDDVTLADRITNPNKVYLPVVDCAP
jgi:glucosylceramidase